MIGKLKLQEVLADMQRLGVELDERRRDRIAFFVAGFNLGHYDRTGELNPELTKLCVRGMVNTPE